jgi:hypothetical protein
MLWALVEVPVSQRQDSFLSLFDAWQAQREEWRVGAHGSGDKIWSVNNRVPRKVYLGSSAQLGSTAGDAYVISRIAQ